MIDVFEGDDEMAISDKDREMMKQVADYFESTRKADDPKAKYKPKREDSRSVNDTAAHFGITRAKAIKMLITMGVYDTPMSQDVQRLRKTGLSIKKIAEELGVSVGTVSSNLPYEDEIHGSNYASDHAIAMREYRAYERKQKERQVQAKQQDENNERKNKDMKQDEADKVADHTDEWKKDLDSRLSFTATDSRQECTPMLSQPKNTKKQHDFTRFNANFTLIIKYFSIASKNLLTIPISKPMFAM